MDYLEELVWRSGNAAEIVLFVEGENFCGEVRKYHGDPEHYTKIIAAVVPVNQPDMLSNLIAALDGEAESWLAQQD